MRGSGRAELRAAVNGPLYKPVFSGSATITNGRIRHFSLPNSLDAINGVIRFDSRGVRLDDVTATMGGGRVQFGGRVGFDGYLPGELNVTARGEGMQLRVSGRGALGGGRRLVGARQLQGADARRHRDGPERHLEPAHRSDGRALRLRRAVRSGDRRTGPRRRCRSGSISR